MGVLENARRALVDVLDERGRRGLLRHGVHRRASGKFEDPGEEREAEAEV